jgi:hypothetical protein
MLMDRAKFLVGGLPRRVPAQLRPLTVIAAVASADLFREGSGLARLSAAVRHRLFGTFRRS